MTRICPATTESLKEAADFIRAGDLVAFPTETVYGLGADACNGTAVAKIFAAKGRPSFNPIIAHAASAAQLLPHVVFSEQAQMLAEKFWPGPLTLILPKLATSTVSDLVTAGLPTLACRVPDHPVALDFIKACGTLVAAPSANISGTMSPTAPHHVLDGLGEKIAMVLAGGPTKYGLESTVLDLSTGRPVILRPGAVTAEEVAETLETDVAYQLEAKEHGITSPGQLLRHYAPNIPLRLKAVDVEDGEALLAFGSLKFMGLKSGGFAKDMPEDSLRNLSESGDLLEAASHLFSYLRQLDDPRHKRIAVMDIPDIGIGIAINDRLRRAANS